MKATKSAYTLRELCKLFGFSEAWVYKFEIYLGLRKWASNRSGKKSSYDLDQVSFFRKIHFLRLSQISLPEIKEIYDLEKKIIDIARVDLSLDEEEETGAEWLRRLETRQEKTNRSPHKEQGKVGYVEVYLTEGIYGGSEGIEFDMEKYARNKEIANKLDSLRNEYKELLQEVDKRANIFYKNMGENLKKLNSYLRK